MKSSVKYSHWWREHYPTYNTLKQHKALHIRPWESIHRAVRSNYQHWRKDYMYTSSVNRTLDMDLKEKTVNLSETSVVFRTRSVK